MLKKLSTLFLGSSLLVSMAFASSEFDHVRKIIQDDANEFSLVKPKVGSYILKDQKSDTKVNFVISRVEHQLSIDFDKYPADDKLTIEAKSPTEALDSLKRIEGRGWQFRSYTSRLTLVSKIDGVWTELKTPSFRNSNGLWNFSAAYYDGHIPGVPGKDPKRNRMVEVFINDRGAIDNVNIKQVWRSGFDIKRQELILEVESVRQ